MVNRAEEMRKRRRSWITAGVLGLVALSCGTAGAADKTKVVAATRQVDQGAKRIGHGDVGPGVTQTAKGIGHTVVEGAKFSGENIKEFFKRVFGR
jgi:hypothetical protein